jgi:hypothetical protein
VRVDENVMYKNLDIMGKKCCMNYLHLEWAGIVKCVRVDENDI